MFQMAKKVTGKNPETIITDGLPAYHDAYKKEFWTQKNPRTEHINAIKLRGDMNNNQMERFNGEVRDREKVMRSLKKEDTPILSGYQIYHNSVRPHMALDGKTPSEMCGLKVEGRKPKRTTNYKRSQICRHAKGVMETTSKNSKRCTNGSTERQVQPIF
jgi:hypothetical protein